MGLAGTGRAGATGVEGCWWEPSKRFPERDTGVGGSPGVGLGSWRMWPGRVWYFPGEADQDFGMETQVTEVRGWGMLGWGQ